MPSLLVNCTLARSILVIFQAKKSQWRQQSFFILIAELIPPPPPPYNSAIGEGPSSQTQQPQMNIFTVTGNQLLVPENNKLPKYEDIFPTGPPSPRFEDFEDFDEISFEEVASSSRRHSSQDPVINVERY